MRYTEEIGNEIREYEIEIEDLEQYRNILKVLDEKCSIVIKKRSNVTGNSMDEAIKKINPMNTSGIRIVGEVKNADICLKGQHLYEVEYFFRQDSLLAYLLKMLLNNYETNADLSGTINIILDYENSYELETLKREMAEQGITPGLYNKYETLKESYLAILECVKKVLIKKTINCTDRKVYKLGEK